MPEGGAVKGGEGKEASATHLQYRRHQASPADSPKLTVHLRMPLSLRLEVVVSLGAITSSPPLVLLRYDSCYIKFMRCIYVYLFIDWL